MAKINKAKVGKYAEMGKRVFQALEFAGIHRHTYAELGEMIGVSPPVIGRLLHGTQSMSNKTAMSISGVTGVDHNWLSNGSGAMSKTISSYTINLKGLTEHERLIVEGLVRTIRANQQQ